MLLSKTGKISMDFKVQLLILMPLLGVIGVRGDCPRSVDPCSSTVYETFDQPSRSTRYNLTADVEDDYSLAEHWYRSVSGAGGDMPTEPVYTGQCNAFAPIWLTEDLPEEEEGIKDIRACASFLYDYCVRNYTIPVKNCGTFNVYCLSAVLDSYDRYCMGSEVVCPDGFTSETGFTPDCDIPVPSTTTTTTTTEADPESYGTCTRDVDPCSSDVYTELDDADRSIHYNVTRFNYHDYTLRQRWYRSVSGAGGDMPTSPVYTGQCNAFAPIWLTSDLPTEEDGIVDVMGCASFLDDTCVRRYHIPIKNCGEFNVYCLYPVMDVYDRFCMGTEVECAEGFTSPTGFTPGCEQVPESYGTCARDVDPCRSDVYTALDDANRSIRYNATLFNQHDYTLSQNWYRSVSGAGGDMPTSTVYTGQCTAYAPIWLTGDLPRQEDGIVDVVACASFLHDTCVRRYHVPIKNCGDFNVYCLYPVMDVYDRFCMGSEVECAEGFWSPNGFTPGCQEIPESSSTTVMATTAAERTTSKDIPHEIPPFARGKETAIAIGISIAVLVLVFLAAAAALVYMRRRNKTNAVPESGKEEHKKMPEGPWIIEVNLPVKKM